MRALTLYEAFDGQRFDNVEACKAYEAAHVETRLVGLTLERIQAATIREDVELADAIEELGNRIAKARREAGDFKRGKKAAAEVETKAPESAAPVPGASKLDEALQRARASGLLAWERREGAVVPEAFAGAKPLHDAWLEGWEGGQVAASRLRDGAVAEGAQQLEEA